MAWVLKRLPSELPYWGIDLDDMDPEELQDFDYSILAAGAEREREDSLPEDQLSVGEAHARKMRKMDTAQAAAHDAEIEKLMRREEHGRGSDGGRQAHSSR